MGRFSMKVGRGVFLGELMDGVAQKKYVHILGHQRLASLM